MSNPYTKKNGQFIVQNYNEPCDFEATVLVTNKNGPGNKDVPEEFLNRLTFQHPLNLITEWNINDVS